MVRVSQTVVLFWRRSTKRSSLRKKVLVSVSLAALLGVSWTLGYLVLTTSGHAQLVFSILFCLCTATQVRPNKPLRSKTGNKGGQLASLA